MHFQLGAMDRAGNLPTFIGKLKVDWIDFPLDEQQFTTLKEGILRGVFSKRQQVLGLDVVRKKSKSEAAYLRAYDIPWYWSQPALEDGAGWEVAPDGIHQHL